MARSNYDFVNATFFFFQALGRRPGGVAWIVLWQFFAYSAMLSLILYSIWPLMALVFEAAVTGGEPQPAEIFAALGGAGLAMFIGVIGAILVALMAQGAWLRLLVHDQVAAVIPFRLGADEGRLFLVNLCFVLLAFAGYLATILVFVLANLAVSWIDGFGGTALQALLNTVLVLATIVIWVIAMVRFAAAPALTVHDRRFRLTEAFAASKRIVGWMVLSYLVLLVLIFVAYVAVSVLQNVVFLIGAADALGALMALDGAEDPEVVFSILGDAFSSGSAIIALAAVGLIQVIFQITYEAAWHGVGAYAAVRHGAKAEPEILEAPADSVGEAPSEG